MILYSVYTVFDFACGSWPSLALQLRPTVRVLVLVAGQKNFRKNSIFNLTTLSMNSNRVRRWLFMVRLQLNTLDFKIRDSGLFRIEKNETREFINGKKAYSITNKTNAWLKDQKVFSKPIEDALPILADVWLQIKADRMSKGNYFSSESSNLILYSPSDCRGTVTYRRKIWKKIQQAQLSMCYQEKKGSRFSKKRALNATMITLSYPAPMGVSAGYVLSCWRSIKSDWNRMRTRLSKYFRFKGVVKYVAFTESTLRGFPHLHVVLFSKKKFSNRYPFLPQKLLSSLWGDSLTVSRPVDENGCEINPIVDIRASRDFKNGFEGFNRALNYVSKYCAKMLNTPNESGKIKSKGWAVEEAKSVYSEAMLFFSKSRVLSNSRNFYHFYDYESRLFSLRFDVLYLTMYFEYYKGLLDDFDLKIPVPFDRRRMTRIKPPKGFSPVYCPPVSYICASDESELLDKLSDYHVGAYRYFNRCNFVEATVWAEYPEYQAS